MPAPANDAIANAITLAPGSGSLSAVDISSATLEGGEYTTFPYPEDKTVWYKFTAAQNGYVWLSTYGSIALDENSGDGTAGVGSWGYFDTRIGLYSGTPGSLTPLQGNDDYPNFTNIPAADTPVPHAGDGDWWSFISRSVTAGVSYYVQAGTYAGYNGTLILEWIIPVVPPPPPTVQQVGDCPTYVHYTTHSSLSQTFWPELGAGGQHTNGYTEWYKPGGNAGDLFLLIAISNKTDNSMPTGYTSVLNQLWDNVPVSSFNNADIDGLLDHTQIQVMVGYRILTSSESSGYESSLTAMFYDGDVGFGVGESAGVRVYRFQCYEMGGGYPNVAFPATPVKVGGFVSADYQLLDDPGNNITYNSINIGGVTPDYIGNHIYMTVMGQHGPGVTHAAEDFIPNTPRVRIDPGPGDFVPGLAGSVGHRYDEFSAGVYVSAKDYFLGAPHFEETYPGAGEARLYRGDTWNDGFIGTVHVDWEDWGVLAGIFGVSILIQAPESARPLNDNIANAYANTTCPVVLIQCVFGQTAEGGESFTDGNTQGKSVWYKWIPTETQTVDINTYYEPPDPLPGESFPPYTEYDTVLAVYSGSPGSLVLLENNDDIPGESGRSGVTLDAVAGTTYYIQVAGWGGDEGRLVLLIDCTGELAAYWGILTTAM